MAGLLLFCFIYVPSWSRNPVQASAGKLSLEERIEQLGSALVQRKNIKPGEMSAMEALYRELKASGQLSDNAVDALIDLGNAVTMRGDYPIMDSLLLLLEEQGCTDKRHRQYKNYRLLEFESVRRDMDAAAMIEQLEAFEKEFEEEKDALFVARLLHAKGAIYGYAEQYLRSIEYFEECAIQYEALDMPLRAAVARGNIGVIYSSIDLDQKAIQYFSAAINVFKEQGAAGYWADYANDIAISYKNVGVMDSALLYVKWALEAFQAENDYYGMAKSYSIRSNTHLERQEYDKALIYNDSSIAICTRHGVRYGLVVNRINRAKIYFAQGDYSLAIEELKKAESVWPHELPGEGRLMLNRLYAGAYQKRGDVALALRYYEETLSTMDTVYDNRLQALMLSMDNSYAEMRADRKITALNESLKTARLQRMIALLGTLLALVAIGAGLVIWLARKRRYELEVDIAHRKLNELKLELEMHQKDTLYADMKGQFTLQLTDELLEKLKALKYALPQEHRVPIDKLIRSMTAVNVEEKVQEIDNKLSSVNLDFEQRLLSAYPDLSPTEVKLCNFIILGLASKDISIIINRSEKTVRNYRSAIRKKMGLEAGESVFKALMAI